MKNSQKAAVLGVATFLFGIVSPTAAVGVTLIRDPESDFLDTVESSDSASVPEFSMSKGLLALGVIVGMLKMFQSKKRYRN